LGSIGELRYERLGPEAAKEWDGHTPIEPQPTRLLKMLSDRFGAFEAIANACMEFARVWRWGKELPPSQPALRGQSQGAGQRG
jgi:hypothetical protein